MKYLWFIGFSEHFTSQESRERNVQSLIFLRQVLFQYYNIENEIYTLL